MVVTNISKQIIDITGEYLGPTADRFIDRISTYHLSKSGSELTANDIPKLAEWLKVSMGLLTDDKSLVDDYIRKVQKLAG